ncbi:unnamed protein product, partial [Prorocentrum cordatum]
ECHGSQAELETMLARSPSSASNRGNFRGCETRGAGGLAAPAPGLARAEREQLRKDAAAGCSPSFFKPVVAPRIVVDGRPQLIAITNRSADREIRALNAHNDDLSDAQKIKLRDERATHAQRSNSAPPRLAFLAMGDFNFSDEPSQSHLVPQAGQRRQTVEVRFRQNQSFWRQLRHPDLFLKASPGGHHDRSSLPFLPPFIPRLRCELNIAQDSDHAIAKLAIETRQPQEKGQRPIADFVFRPEQYKSFLAKMLSEAELGTMADLRRRDVTEQSMTLAAELARNELQRPPLGAGDARWRPGASRSGRLPARLGAPICLPPAV